MNKKELAKILYESGISQADLARRLQVSGSSVSRWLSGEIPISHSTAIAIRTTIRDAEVESEGKL
jgi:transcriptional regulator with XRE-family HTH domain